MGEILQIHPDVEGKWRNHGKSYQKVDWCVSFCVCLYWICGLKVLFKIIGCADTGEPGLFSVSNILGADRDLGF